MRYFNYYHFKFTTKFGFYLLIYSLDFFYLFSLILLLTLSISISLQIAIFQGNLNNYQALLNFLISICSSLWIIPSILRFIHFNIQLLAQTFFSKLIKSVDSHHQLFLIIHFLYINQKNKYTMGNQYNLCKINTQQHTSFPEPTMQVLLPTKLIQESRKTLQDFLNDNVDFFANDSLPILQVLMTEPCLEQVINKFPIERTYGNKKVYFPSLTREDFNQYQGDCIILNYQKFEFYIGSVNHGQKDGKGLHIDSQGNKFNGQWSMDQQNGFGKYEILYPKRVYEGEWKNGKMEGKGSAIYEDKAKYQGNFRRGKKHGIGVLTFLDGATYEGTFTDDLMNGYGTLKTSKGRSISGEWKKGKYVPNKPERSSQTFSINELPRLVQL